jgi:ABC-type nitrate/sulfonate/bicarbonate transport system ATPase subunit
VQQFYQENLQAKREGRRPPYTILIVTHELNEALSTASRVVGLSQYHPGGAAGATIVYDKAAPIFHPNDEKDFTIFVKQREELREAVFDEERLSTHSQYVTFWRDYQAAQTAEGQARAAEGQVPVAP